MAVFVVEVDCLLSKLVAFAVSYGVPGTPIRST
jgi:hypothetical protein